MKILVVAISSHIISFQFLSVSGYFRATQEDQNRSIRSRRLAVTGEKISDYLKRKDFFSLSKKTRISLITGEPVSATTPIELSW